MQRKSIRLRLLAEATERQKERGGKKAIPSAFTKCWFSFALTPASLVKLHPSWIALYSLNCISQFIWCWCICWLPLLRHGILGQFTEQKKMESSLYFTTSITIYLVLVYLLTALIPSEIAFLVNSLNRRRWRVVYTSQLVMVKCLL